MASEPAFVPDDEPSEEYRYIIDAFPMPAHYKGFIERILVPEEMLDARIEQLAKEIHSDYKGKSIHLLCVLDGAMEFFSALTRKFITLNSNPGTTSVPLTYTFIRASSYLNTQSTENVIITPGTMPIELLFGQDVLIVEDLVDTGKTLSKLTDLIHEKGRPNSLRTATLLAKRVEGRSLFTPDYAGFSVPDRFVVGFGIDYSGTFRDLQHVCIVNEAGIKKYRI